jgi:SSS family solute:Na+ symporter
MINIPMDFLLTSLMIYFSILFLIGLIASRRIKSTEDFLLAGRRIGVLLLTFTLAATHFGGGMLMGGIEYGMLHGILGGMWYGISCALGLLALSFIAPRLRELSLFTAPEYLEKRYGGRFLRPYTAVLSLIALTGILAAQIIAMQALLSLFGVPPEIAGALAAGIFILYTFFGGMWAVTLTDFFQLSIAAVGVISIAIIAPAPQVTMQYEPLSAMGIVGIVVPTVMYTLIGQDFYQRFLSAKDAKTSRTGSLLAALIIMGVSFFPAFLGTKIAGNDLNSALAALFSGMPIILVALFVVAILGCIMSTADSLLSASSSHIIVDLFAKTVKDDRKKLAYSRISVLVVGLLALIISYIMPTIIDAIVFSYTIYTAAVFFPLVLGLIWKKGKRVAAEISMVCSTVFVICSLIFTPGDIPLEIAGALVSLLLFVFISIVYKVHES